MRLNRNVTESRLEVIRVRGVRRGDVHKCSIGDGGTDDLRLHDVDVEVASQELHAMECDLLGQHIPDMYPCCGPFMFHGAAMPMPSTKDDLFPKMANVLFEANLAEDDE